MKISDTDVNKIDRFIKESLMPISTNHVKD